MYRQTPERHAGPDTDLSRRSRDRAACCRRSDPGPAGDTHVQKAAPRTTALFGVGPDVAAQLLTTAGDNPDRLHSEAALAHLCGAAPIPASSGRVSRHRLHRGGDRGANHALHTIALCRLRYDQRTRAYLQRRTTEGLSKQEVLRCLKRYIVRDVYTALVADFTALTT